MTPGAYASVQQVVLYGTVFSARLPVIPTMQAGMRIPASHVCIFPHLIKAIVNQGSLLPCLHLLQ